MRGEWIEIYSSMGSCAHKALWKFQRSFLLITTKPYSVGETIGSRSAWTRFIFRQYALDLLLAQPSWGSIALEITEICSPLKPLVVIGLAASGCIPTVSFPRSPEHRYLAIVGGLFHKHYCLIHEEMFVQSMRMNTYILGIGNVDHAKWMRTHLPVRKILSLIDWHYRFSAVQITLLRGGCPVDIVIVEVKSIMVPSFYSC